MPSLHYKILKLILLLEKWEIHKKCSLYPTCRERTTINNEEKNPFMWEKSETGHLLKGTRQTDIHSGTDTLSCHVQ